MSSHNILQINTKAILTTEIIFNNKQKKLQQYFVYLHSTWETMFLDLV